MRSVDVLVVGAGPVGLTMAAELARHGVRARIIDKAPQPSPYCRAIGVSSRTLEVWDDMGMVRDMIDAGIWLEGSRSLVNGQYVDAKVDMSGFPYGSLGLPQNDTERILTRHLAGFGVEVERGISLETLTQVDGEVQTVLLDGSGARETPIFRYVIGCDGAHSVVRKSLGISFEGSPLPAEFMLADVHIDWTVPRGLTVIIMLPKSGAAPDVFAAIPLPEQGRYRVTIIAPPEIAILPTGTDHGLQSERPAPGLEYFHAAADRILAEKATLSDPRWSSLFRISARLAGQYRLGNAFIAGDAAHIHPPLGGQGMNTGIQDAYNLAWKLALVVKGAGHPELLDSYNLERHAVGQDVVERTSISVQSPTRKPQDRLADTQLLISYREGGWIESAASDVKPVFGTVAGDRAPDCSGLRRTGLGSPRRFFDLLRGTEHVLVAYCAGSDPAGHFADMAAMHAKSGLKDFVRVVAITESGVTPPKLPLLPAYEDADGEFAKAYGTESTVFLVRPDGYLAWRGESWRSEGLRTYLGRTFVVGG